MNNIWKWILSIVVALVIIGATVVFLGGTKFLQINAMIEAGKAGGMHPTAVSMGEVQRERWEIALSAVGSVSSVEGIMIRPEAPGVVKHIAFTPGAAVEEGTILVELDQSVEEANLEQAHADLDLAERTLRRANDLYATRSIPEADLDTARAQLAAAKGRLASLEATLAKKTIRAPFDGKLGIKTISLGQYLNPGDPIVALQSMDPMFIEFSLPQRELGRLAQGLEVRARIDAYPGVLFVGTLTAINPEIDPLTRNVRMQATFENPNGQLSPGMFAEIEVIMPEKREVAIVPASAIIYNPSGNRVYVVNQEGDSMTVRQTIVRLGETKGDFVEITAGLDGGEKIVVDGAFKLREGASVFPSEAGTVKPKLDPKPENT